MISFNLAAYLQRKGFVLPPRLFTKIQERTKVSRLTASKYLTSAIPSVDFDKLSKICNVLCEEFPELDLTDLVQHVMTVTTFRGAFSSAAPTYYVGAKPNPDDETELLTSVNDKRAADAIHQLNPRRERTDIAVPLLSDYEQESTGRDTDFVRVYIGSPKVNRKTEVFLADLFGVTPFKPSSGNVVPIAFTPRQAERVDTCILGSGTKMGLSWKESDEGWRSFEFAASERGVTHDAAFVIVSYEPARNAMELAVFGFSGAATRAAGEYLARNRDIIVWPASSMLSDHKSNRNADARQVDIYAIEFAFNTDVSSDAPASNLYHRHYRMAPSLTRDHVAV